MNIREILQNKVIKLSNDVLKMKETT